MRVLVCFFLVKALNIQSVCKSALIVEKYHCSEMRNKGVEDIFTFVIVKYYWLLYQSE